MPLKHDDLRSSMGGLSVHVGMADPDRAGLSAKLLDCLDFCLGSAPLCRVVGLCTVGDEGRRDEG